MKTCYNCKEEKPMGKFYKDGSKKDGHQSRCVECDKKRDKTPARKFSKYKHDAKRRGIGWHLTYEQFVEFWGKSCVYCGESIECIGLDRVNNDGDYDYNNITPCCKDCNMLKGSFDIEKFEDSIIKIYNKIVKDRSNNG